MKRLSETPLLSAKDFAAAFKDWGRRSGKLTAFDLSSAFMALPFLHEVSSSASRKCRLTHRRYVDDMGSAGYGCVFVLDLRDLTGVGPELDKVPHPGNKIGIANGQVRMRRRTIGGLTVDLKDRSHNALLSLLDPLNLSPVLFSAKRVPVR